MGVHIQTKFMSMPWECFRFDFSFGTACGAIMFAAATGKTISCSFGRRCKTVLSLSFLDVYVGLKRQLNSLFVCRGWESFKCTKYYIFSFKF
jgi:hypothetical protein